MAGIALPDQLFDSVGAAQRAKCDGFEFVELRYIGNSGINSQYGAI